MSNKKILVIEDNELNLKLVRTLLELGGFTVLEAANAETGIMLARTEQPDLILMDIQLPGLDGLNATRSLKIDPRTGHIPVVAVTSFAMESDEDRARDAGCVGYISKPINTRSFVAEVNHFLDEEQQ
ncbi:MAG: response regulator [Thermodesulfobacteriota bacterium]